MTNERCNDTLIEEGVLTWSMIHYVSLLKERLLIPHEESLFNLQ